MTSRDTERYRETKLRKTDGRRWSPVLKRTALD